jgi:hypothetical protein
MPFSRRDFVQSSLAAAIPGAAILKTWMDRFASTSLRRLELPSPDPPILLDHNENAYGPSERVRAVWHRLRKQKVTAILAISMVHYEASWLPCTPLTKNRCCLAVDPPKSCAWQPQGWLLIRRHGHA